MNESNENLMMALLCLISEKVVLFNKPTFEDNLLAILLMIGFGGFTLRSLYLDIKKK